MSKRFKRYIIFGLFLLLINVSINAKANSDVFYYNLDQNIYYLNNEDLINIKFQVDNKYSDYELKTIYDSTTLELINIEKNSSTYNIDYVLNFALFSNSNTKIFLYLQEDGNLIADSKKSLSLTHISESDVSIKKYDKNSIISSYYSSINDGDLYIDYKGNVVIGTFTWKINNDQQFESNALSKDLIKNNDKIEVSGDFQTITYINKNEELSLGTKIVLLVVALPVLIIVLILLFKYSFTLNEYKQLIKSLNKLKKNNLKIKANLPNQKVIYNNIIKQIIISNDLINISKIVQTNNDRIGQVLIKQSKDIFQLYDSFNKVVFKLNNDEIVILTDFCTEKINKFIVICEKLNQNNSKDIITKEKIKIEKSLASFQNNNDDQEQNDALIYLKSIGAIK